MQLKTLSEIIYNITNNIHDVLPSANTETGTFISDVFIDPVSNELADLYEQIQLVEMAQSIVTATGNDLDALASNFFITRGPATASSGKLRFYFDYNILSGELNSTMTITAGTIVSTQGNTTNLPVQLVTASDATININDGQSYAFDENSNQYYVDIPAWSATAGANTNIAINTAVVPVSTLDQSVISVTNPSPFQNGSDQESDVSLAMRVNLALLGANIGTQDGYLSFVLTQSGVMDALVVGAGNPLMVRDDGQGGMVDIYIRGKSIAQMTMQFIADVFYITGTGAYTSTGSYSPIVLEYQPLIVSEPNGSLTNDTFNLTMTNLDVTSLIGNGSNYTTNYKNAAQYSLEPGSNAYYLDYQWDFSLAQQSINAASQTTNISSVFPANSVVYTVYTYLTVIGETTPSPEQSITMNGTSSEIYVNAGMLPPGVIGINVYTSMTQGQELLAGSSDYGTSTFDITSMPTSQNPTIPPSGNTAGVAGPSVGPVLQIIPTVNTTPTTSAADLISSTADTEALNKTLFFNPSGSGYTWDVTIGLAAINSQDDINLSEQLNEITNVTNIEYNIDFSQIQWYQVNDYDVASGTYAVVNDNDVYFNPNFNIGILPSDGNIYIIQTVTDVVNPDPNNVPIPTTANRFFVLNNGVWFERRYYQPDFYVEHDVSPTGRGTASEGTQDAIMWLTNASQKPQPNEVLNITYNINQLIDDLQNTIESKRVLTANVMIKQASRAGVNIYLEVSPSQQNYDPTLLNQNVTTRLSNFITNLSMLGGSISKLDIIYIVKGTDGVGSMGINTLSLSRTYTSNLTIDGQDTFSIDTAPYEYLAEDNIYVLVRPYGYMFNNT